MTDEEITKQFGPKFAGHPKDPRNPRYVKPAKEYEPKKTAAEEIAFLIEMNEISPVLGKYIMNQVDDRKLKHTGKSVREVMDLRGLWKC